MTPSSVDLSPLESIPVELNPVKLNPVKLVFATPRKLPKPDQLGAAVVVLDIAFASNAGGSSFEKVTGRFIQAMGSRLIAWVDHHDSEQHAEYAHDPRFVLHTKAQHGACPEIISETLVSRFPACDTIVCHIDFDGVMSAAKWLRGGSECYPGADLDAFAIDTRSAEPQALAQVLDRALRVRGDEQFLADMVSFLANGAQDPLFLAEAQALGADYLALERNARNLADRYVEVSPGVLLVEVSEAGVEFDRTLLLLLGQQRGKVAVMVNGESSTFAAHYRSGINFLTLFNLSGGMPTVVSIRSSQLENALRTLEHYFSATDSVSANDRGAV